MTNEKQIWYKVHYCNKITQLEVIKETEKCIYINSPFGGTRIFRYFKLSESTNYFKTWEEAHNFLLDRQNKKVEYVKKEYNKAKSILGQIKNMKEE